MAIGYAAGNLGLSATRRERRKGLLQLLLRVEAWLDARRNAKALYTMDDRELADIGLSRTDVEVLNVAFWQDHLPAPFSR